jgi:nuclear pore complex protein Nup98-Nup96
MSGFGGFGSSGFGSNNNQTSSAFGGFGNTTSTAGGFGAGSGFGANANNNTGSVFGGGSNANTNTTSAFGELRTGTSNTSQSNPLSTGGFGANTNNNTSSIFGGNKTSAFGATTSAGGSVFGSNTATSGTGFGGFGGSSNTTSGFGGASTGGGFGANKTGFGTGTTASVFGGGGSGTTPSTFGTSSTTTFGNTSSPFGAGNTQNNGTANTANTPFTPMSEKEQASNVTNYYQTITAGPQYNKFSVEELRAVDYSQGRKYGNQSGQSGAFGAATSFGGFGNSTPSATAGFGAGTTTGTSAFGGTGSNAFGSTSNTAPAFGSSTSAFGAAKPATNMFGGTGTSAASGSTLFGTSGTASGFGANNNTTTTGFGASTSSPFGGAQQNKPFGGGFGSTSTTSTPFGGGGGFGASSTNTGSTLFANQNQQAPSTGFGGFGGNNSQQAQPASTGGTAFGGFGQAPAKPSLFGGASATNTGTNLFGNQPAQQTGGNLFGSTNNQTSNLFGKPANSSPFGQSATGGSNLFGNTLQNTQSNPFGGGNQQASAGLSTSTNLFGQPQNQQQNNNSGPFGASQQQPGLFGTPQQSQQAQPTHLIANLADSPYGGIHLFANLGSPAQSLGPIATPLSSASKSKKQAIIPQHRIVPSASSRLITPQKRPTGYGFSYSNYNSPASPASNASPISYGNSGLGASMSRSLGKSLSTSNLRHSYTAQETLISPSAFANVTRSGPGSMKKLNVNRNVSNRRSLFGNDTATPLTKKVSFEHDTPASDNASPTVSSSALVRVEEPETVGDGNAASPVQTNGSNELAVVPEEPSENSMLEITNRKAVLNQKDQIPGGYKMSPTIPEIQSMSRDQRSKIKDFTVSREGVGHIVFSQVDLNNIPLEQICGHIVELELRRATVYGDKSTVAKPARGEGVNVPSLITLENSWPRARVGRMKVPEKSTHAVDKHIRLLKAHKDTNYVSYDPDAGRWVFQVEHYTTYELIYDDDESVADSMVLDSIVNENDGVQGTTTGFAQSTPFVQGNSSNTSSAGSLDDTFEFKTDRRVAVPGQFNDDEFDGDFMELMEDSPMQAIASIQEEDEEEDNIPQQHELMEQSNFSRVHSAKPTGAENSQPRSIIDQDTPTKIDALVLEANWTEQLLQTASPKKRDRYILRENPTQPALYNVSDRKPLEANKASTFGTTLDIMKSLFPSSPKTGDKQLALEVRV